MLIDYRKAANPYVYSTGKTSFRGMSRASRAGVIYGTAASIGYVSGGLPGALAGVALVPEVIAIPLILA